MGRNWQNNRPFSRQNYDRKKRYNPVSGFNENYETSRYGNFNSNNYRDPMVEDYNNAYLMKEKINNAAMCLTSLIQKFESEYLKVEKRFLELKQTPIIKDMNYIRSFCYRYDRFRRDLQTLGSLLETLSPTPEMLHSMLIDLTLYMGESVNSNYIDTMVISRLNMLLDKIDDLQRDSCGYDEVYIARARAGTTWDFENQRLVLVEENANSLDKMPTEGKDETIVDDTYLDENSEKTNQSSELESAEVEILQRDENDFEVQGSGMDLVTNNENNEMLTQEDEQKLNYKQELSQTAPHASEIISSVLIAKPELKEVDTVGNYEKSMLEEYIRPDQAEEVDEEIVVEKYLDENTEEIKGSTELEDSEVDFRPCNGSEEIKPEGGGAELMSNNENEARPTEHDEEKLPEKQELSQTTSQAIEITSSLLIVEPQSGKNDTELRESMLEEYEMHEQTEKINEEIVDEKYLDENAAESKVSKKLEDTVADLRQCNESGEVESEDCGAELKPEHIDQGKIEDSKLETILNKKDKENPLPPHEDLKSKLRENTESTAKLLDASEEIDVKLLPKEENKTETLSKLPMALFEAPECEDMPPRRCKRYARNQSRNIKKNPKRRVRKCVIYENSHDKRGSRTDEISSKDKAKRKIGNLNQVENVGKNPKKRVRRCIDYEITHEKLGCRADEIPKSDKFIYNLYMFSLRGRGKLSKDKN